MRGLLIGALRLQFPRQAAVKYEDDLRRTAPDLLSAILNAPDNPDQALAKLGKHRPNVLADNESTNS